MQSIVIRFGRLGDMLLLAPLMERLHRGYGEPCLLMGTGPWSLPMFAAHPNVARVIQVDARHQPLAFSPQRWQMLHALRVNNDAPVHVCEAEPRAVAKIRRMLALAHVPPKRCVFVEDASPLADEHWVERLLRGCGHAAEACVGAWHPPALPDAAAPRLYLREADQRDCDAWLRKRGWRGEPIWLVQPFNKRSVRWNGRRDEADDDKAWPAQRWSGLLHALHADHPDARVVLCGTPREAPLLDTIGDGTRAAGIDVAARDLPLRRFMALCEIARGMLSVDTGPAHVAAAMGCPLVVLFGAQSPRVWCPRSPTGSTVIALGGPPQRSRVVQIPLDEVTAALCSLPAREPELPHAA
ncbi:MAG: glycosyltransferase family 9 protein [Rhodanobacteraceae bacterium]